MAAAYDSSGVGTVRPNVPQCDDLDLSEIQSRRSSLGKRGGYFGAAYEPSPDEIRAACLAIQAEWTPDERQKRRYAVQAGNGFFVLHPDAMTVPTCRLLVKGNAQ